MDPTHGAPPLRPLLPPTWSFSEPNRLTRATALLGFPPFLVCHINLCLKSSDPSPVLYSLHFGILSICIFDKSPKAAPAPKPTCSSLSTSAAEAQASPAHLLLPLLLLLL